MLQSAKNQITKATRQQFPDGIAAYGTDALRFTFCALASNARTVRFDIARVEGYRNFCNKLWNAARYVLMQTETEVDLGDGAFQYSEADQWIFSQLQRTIGLCHHYYETYRFDLLANTLYDFVWHAYCDWYLELSKAVLYDDHALGPMKRGTRRTLIRVLADTLKLLHPIMPFITETIWQRITKLTSENAETIMLSAFPQVQEDGIQPALEEEIEWLQAVIQSIRTIRSEMGISPAKRIPLILRHITPTVTMRLNKFHLTLMSLAKLSDIHEAKEDEILPISATSVVGELELLIPMAELIDKDAELIRLKKELVKLDDDIKRAEGKLNNPSFKDRAPADVIAKEEEKLSQARQARQKLEHHQEKINAL
jgi:valyl-tRNA synthetase